MDRPACPATDKEGKDTTEIVVLSRGHHDDELTAKKIVLKRFYNGPVDGTTWEPVVNRPNAKSPEYE